MKKIILTVLFTTLVIIVSYLTIFGQKGYIHLNKLSIELASIEDINSKYIKENKLIRKEIDLLKYSTEYIEDKARKDLGLVKDKEIIYHLKKTDK